MPYESRTGSLSLGTEVRELGEETSITARKTNAKTQTYTEREHSNVNMSAADPSKEMPPSFNPGYPPVYGAGPMPGVNAVYDGYPPMYGAGPTPGVNASYDSPPYNSGYPYGYAVTTQPTVIVAPARAHETDYLGYSIFTMLCCCLPIGIGALIYSIKTRDANNMGDATRAHQSSRTALTLNNVALGVGIAIMIAWVAYVIYINVAFRQTYSNQYYG